MKAGIAALSVALLLLFGITVLNVTVLSNNNCGPTPNGSPSGPGGVPSGQYSKPMKSDTYVVSSPYGVDRGDYTHRGIDLAGPDGAPIYAFADGVVAEAGPAGGFGQWIVLDHMLDGEKYSTVYGHMWDNGLRVSTGDTVTAGQHIADVGSNGGSTGPHLHFEMWQGGRIPEGTEADPTPWIEQAVDAGTQGSRTPQPDTPGPPPRKAPTGELPPMPPELGNETGFQRSTVHLARVIADQFGDRLDTIGGYREPSGNGLNDHTDGLAVDIMIPNYSSTEGIALGQEIMEFIQANEEALDIKYQIWRSMYYPAGGQASTYTQGADSGDTQQHRDHVHVSTNGGGYPSESESYSSASISMVSASRSGSVDCPPAINLAGGDVALREDGIPPELVKWVRLAGRTCPAVNGPLIAGLADQESGFSSGAQNAGSGASGYGQFIPSTWAFIGWKVDENGEQAGPPGSGSSSDPADSMMAVGRYLCQIHDEQVPLIESGAIKGDPTQLMLAGYNAGPHRVVEYAGVPPFAETQAYVVQVPEKAQKYAGEV